MKRLVTLRVSQNILEGVGTKKPDQAKVRLASSWLQENGIVGGIEIIEL